MTQAAGQPQIQIFPESETRFFIKAVNAQVTFVKNAQGRVDHIILHQGGDRLAKRIE